MDNNALIALIRQEAMRNQGGRNLGFAGPEGGVLNMLAMQPDQQMQPMNTIRMSSGEYITPQGTRSMQPAEFSRAPQQQMQGSPVDVFGQGKGFMQPDGTIIGTNAQGQQFKVQPSGTNEANQRARDADMQRKRMEQQMRSGELDIRQKEAELRGGGVAKPSFSADMGGFIYPPSAENPQGRFVPVAGAPKGVGGPKLTEGQAKATTFASQMASASNELDKLEAAGFDPTSTSTQLQTNLAGGIGNVFTSPQAQQAKQTQNQWSEAFLRVKTGAAATEPEVQLNNKTFFPQIGDSPAVIAQKKRMRVQAENDVLNMSGPGREVATQRTAPQDTADIDALLNKYK